MRDGRDSPEWSKIRQRVRIRDQYRCQSCGVTPVDFAGIDLHVHHIHPADDGGSNSLDNLVLLCKYCHNSVHAKNPDDGRYTLDLIENGRPSFYVRETARDRYDLKETDLKILDILIENGITKLSEIIEEIDYSRSKVRKHINRLMYAGYIGKPKRGHYAYLTESRFYELCRKKEEGTEEMPTVEAFDPEGDELDNDPREE